MNKKLFFKAFLRNPRQTGSVIQSSPFLARKMIEPVDFQKAKLIVEFGAGTGVITEKILEKMSRDAVLLCFEVDEGLFRKLKGRIQDPRVKLIRDSAENLGEYLDERGKADCIISGLPLVSLSKATSQKITAAVMRHLKGEGKYIQFQYSLTSKKEFKSLFFKVEIGFALLNIPPAFIYVCTR